MRIIRCIDSCLEELWILINCLHNGFDIDAEFVWFQTKKTGETSAAKPRPKASMGASPILLPPPPGGAKLSAPAKPAFTNNPSPSTPISQTSSVTSTRAAGPPASNLDLLVDLGHLANTQSQPSGTADGWDDFARYLHRVA